MSEGEQPRTVIRPPLGGANDSARTDVFAGLAGPLLALGADTARNPRPDPKAIADEARRRVEDFEAAALKARVPIEAISAARDALVAVMDARARSNPAMDPGAWSRARRHALPGLPERNAELIAGQRAMAEALGPQRHDLVRFLRHCEEAIHAAAPAHAEAAPPWGLIVPLAVTLILATWAGSAEWRYAARLLADLPSLAAVVDPAVGNPAATAQALYELHRGVETVKARAGGGPLGIAALLGPYAPGARAQARYMTAADRLMPPILAAALGEALATEGKSRETYDTLRALAMLDGAAPWQPSFLVGWMEDRRGVESILGALAPHMGALRSPPVGLPAPDPTLLLQARKIAAEGDLADYAFLELTRDRDARALPGWSASEISELTDILISRSGQSLAEPLPGLLTTAGWTYARDGGARRAIDQASRAWLDITHTPPPAIVSDAAVLERLQRATLDAWREKLADLRVRPFTDSAGALLVSGLLAQPNSPLEGLFRATWREVGGEDRSRSAEDQQRIAATFGPTIEFVLQGKLASISQLFAGLNVALRVREDGNAAGRRRLMDVQYRAASITALNQAPRLVAQVIEDVLAQVATTRGAGKGRPAPRWDRELLGTCQAALGARYPFVADGPDADYAAVAGFLGSNGALLRFIAVDLAPLLDTSASPWSWKPEARLSGFSPRSAVFLERATAAGRALFPDPTATSLTVSVLAQSGTGPMTMQLGGADAALEPSGTLGNLTWPGARPSEGLEIRLPGGGAPKAWPGPWGLMKFLDGAHSRARDDGQRFLLDFRVEGRRIFLELVFPEAVNLASARAGLSGLACPTIL